MEGYLSKFEIRGNILWVKQFGVSTGNIGYNQISYTEYNDNGILIDSVQFGTKDQNHSYGNQNFNNLNGSSDGFVVKYK